MKNMKKYGLASVVGALTESENTLNTLINKLRHIDEKLSLAIEVILGRSRDIPRNLIAKIEAATTSSKNVSNLVRVINELYVGGELNSVEYLTLMGYVANKFKASYIEDPQTLANVGRAVEEITSTFSSSLLPLIPEPSPSIRQGVRELFIKFYEVPRPIVMYLVVAVLLPLAAYFTYSLSSRSRYPAFVRKALRTSDLLISSLSFPEDTVSIYWLAVDILSKVVAVKPWETHREYLARLEREFSNQRVLSVFRVLTEEYEKVRYAGLASSLNRRVLVDLLFYIEKEL
ncbi:MAG: DUF4129 domain-containing protein [Sulfolobales archaeon]|nr:DUF4129 domain-containing protein [Sulfolobales archaeon]MDW8082337.1 DUF4129 domain-containing protein [Sulfolobales archaeon]